MSYPKTDNPFPRDEETHKLILDAGFRRPDLGQIGLWPIVTEKIDGTNIQIILDWGHDEELDLWRPVVDVKGRTDKASLPKNFVQEAFDVEEPYELTEDLLRGLAAITDLNILDLSVDPVKMIVYGEGYGPGIQKIGVQYALQKSFRAFDVVTYRGIAEHGHWGPGLWRTWADVRMVADILGIKAAPELMRDVPLDEIVEYVRRDSISRVAYEENTNLEPGTYIPAEGVVVRTDPYLYDYRGNRVLFKLKGHDLP